MTNRTPGADEWDARAERDVGRMIARYLDEQPPPAGSELAEDFATWARNLERIGEARLSRLAQEEAQHEAGTDLEEFDRKRRQQKAIWKSVPKAERERAAIELIGEGGLTITELTLSFREHFGVDRIYDGHVRNIAMRLVAAGELARESEPFRGKVRRYRYFRRADLSGPIAELERAFHEQDGEGR